MERSFSQVRALLAPSASMAALSVFLVACSSAAAVGPRVVSLDRDQRPISARAVKPVKSAAAYAELYSFSGYSEADGAYPSSPLTDINGVLYGSTQEGGNTACGGLGCGTIFSFSPSADKESVVYSFKGKPDGILPFGGLTSLGGTLYGTTQFGGTGGCASCNGDGTVFTIAKTGVEQVLHSFQGAPSDGAEPESGLTNIGGILYGVTGAGGLCYLQNGCGTVYSITKKGTESVLYSFEGEGVDGIIPVGNLTNVKGTLYGVTSFGGTTICQNHGPGCGTVFSITTSGSEKVLHVFQGGPADGATPYAGLINLGGTLYGTTYEGGSSGAGTVFKISTSGTETVLHSFSCPVDGGGLVGGLTNVGGILYGTTAGCGGNGYGTIFKITKTGFVTVLYAFDGVPDGANPTTSLTNVDGTLYGTTNIGGNAGCNNSGCGTIFSLLP